VRSKEFDAGMNEPSGQHAAEKSQTADPRPRRLPTPRYSEVGCGPGKLPCQPVWIVRWSSGARRANMFFVLKEGVQGAHAQTRPKTRLANDPPLSPAMSHRHKACAFRDKGIAVSLTINGLRSGNHEQTPRQSANERQSVCANSPIQCPERSKPEVKMKHRQHNSPRSPSVPCNNIVGPRMLGLCTKARKMADGDNRENRNGCRTVVRTQAALNRHRANTARRTPPITTARMVIPGRISSACTYGCILVPPPIFSGTVFGHSFFLRVIDQAPE